MRKIKFQEYKNTINLHAIFGNMYRPKHVLIVLRDIKGNYLLGAKPDFYPQNIFRLIGGGIDKGETPLNAAIREIKEELQIDVTSKDLKPLAKVETSGTFENKLVKNNTYIFEYLIGDINVLKPSDDIAYLETMSPYDVKNLIQRYKELSNDNWYEAEDGYKHCWSDYGEMYSFIHQIALELTRN